MTTARWLTEADVAAALDMRAAIDALDEVLRLAASGQAHNMVKTHTEWQSARGHATLHAIGAVAPDAGLVGTKTWAHTPGGAAPYLLLFDSESGALRAVIEAFGLGQLRTGAISGVATRLLAAADADEMAIVGTGKQALGQVAAVAAVRPLRHVRVFGRNRDAAAAFRDRVEAELGLSADTAPSAADAVRDAPVVTLVTRATEPVLDAGTPARGAHVNAVGAITPERIEFDPAMLDRCAIVAADSVDQARALSAELRQHYGDGAGWANVLPLHRLAASGGGRPAGADLTMFKSLGVGLSDLSLGVGCLAHAERHGLGSPIAAPVRVDPIRSRVSERGGG